VGISAGVAAYRFVKLAPRIGVTPSIGIQYSYRHIALDDMAGNELTNSDNHLGVSLTGNFGFLGPAGMIYGISPSLTLGDNVQFSLAFSLIAPLH
jgi:hypothetical protein